MAPTDENASKPLLHAALLAVVVGEVILALGLGGWFGLLRFGLAPIAFWGAVISGPLLVGAALRWALRTLRKRRYQVRLRSLLLGVAVASSILAFVVTPVLEAVP